MSAGGREPKLSYRQRQEWQIQCFGNRARRPWRSNCGGIDDYLTSRHRPLRLFELRAQFTKQVY